MAYGDESEGLWQGPLPTGYRLEAGNLVVTLADGQVQLEARDTNTSVHYEVSLINVRPVYMYLRGLLNMGAQRVVKPPTPKNVDHFSARKRKILRF